MRIIILEGISTSGKTSIISLLKDFFEKEGLKFKVIDEDETLMPLLDNKDFELAKKHLKRILLKYLDENLDFLIFDRFHLTHLFRTNSNLDDFCEIELLLKEKEAKVIFLKIDDASISKRIFDSMKNRSKAWKTYVNSKGDKEEIIQYYIKQQRELLINLEKSEVSSEIFDTTNTDFENIVNKVLDLIFYD